MRYLLIPFLGVVVYLLWPHGEEGVRGQRSAGEIREEAPYEPLAPLPPTPEVERSVPAALEGVVRDADGRPVVNAVVRLGLLVTRTDSEGRYRFAEAPREWQQVEVLAGGLGRLRHLLRVPPDGLSDFDFQLMAAASVRGVVSDAEGRPVADAMIATEEGGLTTRSDEVGSYRLEGLGEEGVRFVAEKDGVGRAVVHLLFEAGVEREWNPRLLPLERIEVRVVEADGTPVVNALLDVRQGIGRQILRADADGIARLFLTREETRRLWIWRDGGTRSDVPDAMREVRGTDARVEVQLDAPPPRGALQGSIALPDGAPGVGARVRIWPEGLPVLIGDAVAAEEGRFAFPDLKPGPYRIEIHLDGFPTLHLPLHHEDRSDLGALRFPAPAHLRVRLAAPGPPPQVQSRDGAITYSTRLVAEQEWLSEGLMPGRYLIALGTTGQSMEVELFEGRDEVAELLPRESVEVIFLLGAATRLEVAIEDALGRPVLTRRVMQMEGGELPWRLVPGPYRIAVNDFHGASALVDFEVPSATPIRVPLR